MRQRRRFLPCVVGSNLGLELLEQRVTPSTYTVSVSNLKATGAGTMSGALASGASNINVTTFLTGISVPTFNVTTPTDINFGTHWVNALAGNTGPLFNNVSGGTLTLENGWLKVDSTNGSPGLLNTNGSLVLSTIKIEGHGITNNGATVTIENSCNLDLFGQTIVNGTGTLTVSNSIITGRDADAIDDFGGSVTIDNNSSIYSDPSYSDLNATLDQGSLLTINDALLQQGSPPGGGTGTSAAALIATGAGIALVTNSSILAYGPSAEAIDFIGLGGFELSNDVIVGSVAL